MSIITSASACIDAVAHAVAAKYARDLSRKEWERACETIEENTFHDEPFTVALYLQAQTAAYDAAYTAARRAAADFIHQPEGTIVLPEKIADAFDRAVDAMEHVYEGPIRLAIHRMTVESENIFDQLRGRQGDSAREVNPEQQPRCDGDGAPMPHPGNTDDDDVSHVSETDLSQEDELQEDESPEQLPPKGPSHLAILFGAQPLQITPPREVVEVVEARERTPSAKSPKCPPPPQKKVKKRAVYSRKPLYCQIPWVTTDTRSLGDTTAEPMHGGDFDSL